VAQVAPHTPLVVELDSPMHRHGIPTGALAEVAELLPQINFRGIALHLPPIGNRLAATRRTLTALATSGINPGTLWVSHLTESEISALRTEHPNLTLRPRVGTALWLGNRGALQASGQVLDSHEVSARAQLGYRQRRSGRAGTVLVVAGGTAHGVGLRSPASGTGLVRRLRGLASDALQNTNHPPSGFSWQGRRLRYADVPHMQVSMLYIPSGRPVPPLGARLPCEVRLTVSSFDTVDLAVDLSAS
jgi:hypothetical protein